MGIRVRATQICYHNHKRNKVGEIFEIRNMEAFSKTSMSLVDAKATDKVDKPEDERGGSALSEGTKALHQGKADQPKNAGAAADAAVEAAEKKAEAAKVAEAEEVEIKRRALLTDEERAAEDKEKEASSDQGPAKENETDGNEDVI